jgi:hypothetical protein
MADPMAGLALVPGARLLSPLHCIFRKLQLYEQLRAAMNIIAQLA